MPPKRAQRQYPANAKNKAKNKGSASEAQGSRASAALTRRSILPPPRDSFSALADELAAKIDSEFIVEKTSQSITKSELEEFLRAAVRDCIATVGPHRTWLAEIDRLARNARDLPELRTSISAYLRQAGITRIDDWATDETRFIIGSGKGLIETTQPAYVDLATGRTIIAGRARSAGKDKKQMTDEENMD